MGCFLQILCIERVEAGVESGKNVQDIILQSSKASRAAAVQARKTAAMVGRDDWLTGRMQAG